MMNLLEIVKLAKILAKLEDITTDKGVLTSEKIEVGNMVYTEKEGNTIAAEDGDYILEDGRTMVVAEGKISEIKDAPAAAQNEEAAPAEGNEGGNTEEAPAEAEEDEKDLKIKELTDALAAKDEEIKRLIDEIESLKNAPVEELPKEETERPVMPFKTYKKY